MHDTLSSDIKAYIDEKLEFNNNIFIRGWAFHIKHGVLPTRVLYNGNIAQDAEVTLRQDVSDFYKRTDISICGWRVKMPMNTIGFLQMNVDNNWVNVLQLNTNNSTKSSVMIIDDLNNTTELVKEQVKQEQLSNTYVKDFNVSSQEELTKLLSQLTANSSNIHSINVVDIGITTDLNPPRLVVVDNFYKNPDSIRKFALECDLKEHKSYHKGKRSDECFRFAGLKEAFEKVLGAKITNWEKYGTNGCFQSCVAGDQLVYHCDDQQYAGMIYLTPDAPPQSGTSFYRSKHTKKMKVPSNEHDTVFKNGYLDSTEFELVDTVGNVYNRLVLFDAKTIHAASEYFGTNVNNGRLFQLFFFDIEGYNRVN